MADYRDGADVSGILNVLLIGSSSHLPSTSYLLISGLMFMGEPFVNVDAKSTVGSIANGYMLKGEPFVGAR